MIGAVGLVCLGAALGAGVRQVVGTTLIVNLVGSFVLGLLVGADVGEQLMLALGVGFCGALTTWSTLSFDVLTVARTRGVAVATGLLTVSVLSGVLAAAVGFGIGQGV